MNWKRIGNALLFPPAAVLIVLTPIAAAALVYSMLRLEETSPVRIGSYVLAFYTLVIVCVRVPKVARSIGTFKRENKYIQFWSNDPRLRMNITVGGSVLWNGAYAALQLGLCHLLPVCVALFSGSLLCDACSHALFSCMAYAALHPRRTNAAGADALPCVPLRSFASEPRPVRHNVLHDL